MLDTPVAQICVRAPSTWQKLSDPSLMCQKFLHSMHKQWRFFSSSGEQPGVCWLSAQVLKLNIKHSILIYYIDIYMYTYIYIYIYIHRRIRYGMVCTCMWCMIYNRHIRSGCLQFCISFTPTYSERIIYTQTLIYHDVSPCRISSHSEAELLERLLAAIEGWASSRDAQLTQLAPSFIEIHWKGKAKRDYATWLWQCHLDHLELDYLNQTTLSQRIIAESLRNPRNIPNILKSHWGFMIRTWPGNHETLESWIGHHQSSQCYVHHKSLRWSLCSGISSGMRQPTKECK